MISVVISVTVVLMTRIRGDIGETALDGDVDTLVGFLFLLTGIVAISAIFTALAAFFLGRFSGSVGYKLRSGFIHYFLHIPYAVLEKSGSGESMSIYTNDVPRSADLIGDNRGSVMSLIENAIFFLAAMTFLFITDWTLTLIVLALIPCLMMIQLTTSKPIQKWSKKASEETAAFNAVVNDSLQNVATIVAYGLEEVLETRYISSYDQFMAIFKRYIKSLLTLAPVGAISSIIPLAVILVVAAVFVINGKMSVSGFLAYSAMLMLIGEFLSTLSENLALLQVNVASAKRLAESTSEAAEDFEAGEIPDLGPMVAISFSNVSFSYDDGSPLVLDEVSFEIQPGSKAAIVGKSGSGKSTILKLLTGLYQPVGGDIALNGYPAVKMNKDGLRDVLAYVPQNSFLFPVSIGENIALGNKSSGKDRLEKACADAGVLDFINTLPDGFRSVLAESSENISGGQRQRIALARAFYKNAPVILFDEATSALDSATESAILRNFETAVKGKTVVMVAHRTQAISICDTIIVLEGGKVSGIGNHEELLKSNSVYRSLYHDTTLEEAREGE